MQTEQQRKAEARRLELREILRAFIAGIKLDEEGNIIPPIHDESAEPKPYKITEVIEEFRRLAPFGPEETVLLYVGDKFEGVARVKGITFIPELWPPIVPNTYEDAPVKLGDYGYHISKSHQGGWLPVLKIDHIGQEITIKKKQFGRQ